MAGKGRAGIFVRWYTPCDMWFVSVISSVLKHPHLLSPEKLMKFTVAAVIVHWTRCSLRSQRFSYNPICLGYAVVCLCGPNFSQICSKICPWSRYFLRSNKNFTLHKIKTCAINQFTIIILTLLDRVSMTRFRHNSQSLDSSHIGSYNILLWRN